MTEETDIHAGVGLSDVDPYVPTNAPIQSPTHSPDASDVFGQESAAALTKTVAIADRLLDPLVSIGESVMSLQNFSGPGLTQEQNDRIRIDLNEAFQQMESGDYQLMIDRIAEEAERIETEKLQERFDREMEGDRAAAHIARAEDVVVRASAHNIPQNIDLEAIKAASSGDPADIAKALSELENVQRVEAMVFNRELVNGITSGSNLAGGLNAAMTVAGSTGGDMDPEVQALHDPMDASQSSLHVAAGEEVVEEAPHSSEIQRQLGRQLFSASVASSLLPGGAMAASLALATPGMKKVFNLMEASADGSIIPSDRGIVDAPAAGAEALDENKKTVVTVGNPSLLHLTNDLPVAVPDVAPRPEIEVGGRSLLDS